MLHERCMVAIRRHVIGELRLSKWLPCESDLQLDMRAGPLEFSVVAGTADDKTLSALIRPILRDDKAAVPPVRTLVPG